MQLKKWVAGVAVLSLVSTAAVVIADDAKPAATTQPTEKHAGMGHGRAPTLPFGLAALTDLTDDQKSKIADIHKQELAAETALRDKEQTDLMALLTDDQKAQLKEIKDKQEAEKKAEAEASRAKRAQQKAEEMKAKADGIPTTAPSAK